MSTYRILVVDDEEDLCEILQFNLETEGYEVDVAYSAEEALKKDISVYNLLLLDVMMGEMSGFKMARQINEDPRTAAIPVIFLTAKDSETDRLTGFNIGADDYISKPFSIREVIARVKAVIRRADSNKKIDTAPVKKLSYEMLEMDISNKKVLLEGIEIPFTKKEFEILKLFLENKNRVFSRDEMLTRVWTDEVIVLDRTIDVNITRLRKKIGPYGKNIVTRLGYGYCFEE
jgi:two-component system, OmpR family, alkaline phosphatase synthesis response regulator PhoP